jgi:fibronectin type 3 domain-containing protein
MTSIFSSLVLAVLLTWTAPAASPDLVSLYQVYRSPAGESAFALLGSSATTSYDDSSAVTGQTYDYVILSVDTEGTDSGPSNVIRVTAAASSGPAAPTGLTAKGIQQ